MKILPLIVSLITAIASNVAMATDPTPGSSETNPVLPDSCTLVYDTTYTCNPRGKPSLIINTKYNFPDPQSGKWFDPPLMLGYIVDLQGGALDDLIAPSYVTNNNFFILANGNLFAPTERTSPTYVNYAHGLTSFAMIVTYGFPTLAVKMSFLGQPSSMSWTSILDWDQIPDSIRFGSPVPESSTQLQLLVGLLAGFGVFQRRLLGYMAAPGKSNLSMIAA